MEREAVLALVSLLVSGPLLLLPNLLPSKADTDHREGTAWAAIWWAFVPLALALALLAGWAWQESDPSDEAVSPGRIALAISLAIPWGRALYRAATSLRSHRRIRGAATVGILRPRAIVDPEYASRVPEAVLAAALAHERAHVEHRDPLRLWLAQAATDLQWPLPAARERFERWRNALEWARDDDARRGGVRGEDLAAAILAAARSPGPASTSALGLYNPGEALRARVLRLLAPLPEASQDRSAFRWLVPMLIIAVVVGATLGDPIVRVIAEGP